THSSSTRSLDKASPSRGAQTDWQAVAVRVCRPLRVGALSRPLLRPSAFACSELGFALALRASLVFGLVARNRRSCAARPTPPLRSAPQCLGHVYRLPSHAEPCDMRRRCATCCSERRSPSRVNDSSPGVVGRPLPPTSRWVWGLLPGQPDSYAATRHFSDSPPQPRCFG